MNDIRFTEWVALKTGIWFDNETMLWNIPDFNVEEWREEHGKGFPTDQFRFTTEELYKIYAVVLSNIKKR